MAGESGLVTEVTQQEGDRVLLSVPMVGFPRGFKLSPGDRVVLVNDDQGPAVRPLVRTLRVDEVSGEGTDTLRADDQRFAIQENTVRAALGEGQGGPYDVFVVDRGSAEGPEHVISVRSR